HVGAADGVRVALQDDAGVVCRQVALAALEDVVPHDEGHIGTDHAVRSLWRGQLDNLPSDQLEPLVRVLRAVDPIAKLPCRHRLLPRRRFGAHRSRSSLKECWNRRRARASAPWTTTSSPRAAGTMS